MLLFFVSCYCYYIYILFDCFVDGICCSFTVIVLASGGGEKNESDINTPATADHLIMYCYNGVVLCFSSK